MQRKSRPKVAVGLSGGVDSAAAALLLKERDYDLLGVTMTLGRSCDIQTLSEAQSVARQLDLPLEVVDLSAAFREYVTDYIRADYLSGRTPNPCVRCNEFVKFSLLPRHAFEALGCDMFATGHYARLEKGALLRGLDRGKDQSYFLYRVRPEILERTIFPLGELTKSDAREIVSRAGIVLPEKGESQDFCGGDVRELLPREPREGEVVTVEGKVIGHHHGYWNFTVGMRKGLGIGGGVPFYVVRIDPAANRVIVGTKSAAFVSEFAVTDLVWLADREEVLAAGAAGCLTVKVRSAGEPKGPAVLREPNTPVHYSSAKVVLREPIHGVAPGQSAVFYSADRVLAGGVIAV